MRNVLRFLVSFSLICAVASCTSYQRLIVQQAGDGKEFGEGKMHLGMGWAGEITILVAGQTFNGNYVIVRGSQTTLGVGQLSDGGGAVNLQSLGVSMASISMSNGSALLRSGDGVSMKCVFQVGDRLVGFGVCGTSDGKVYDLQIIH